MDIRATADPYNLVGTITDFTGTPVDIECMNASAEYDIEHNWIAILEEVPEGFIVQMMQFDLSTSEITLVATSDPLPGIPMSLDVDDHNFKIHVLAEYEDVIEATRFTYEP